MSATATNLTVKNVNLKTFGDSDTESMTEQVDQSLAANGSSTEQQETTADNTSPSKLVGVVTNGNSGDVSS